MAFMLGQHLVFLDRFQFMASSLSRLDKFKYTTQVFKDDELALMRKKSVYPYDFMDSFQKFDYPTLPTRGDFYSLLINENLSEEQYQHAQKVWNKFGLKNMGEYHDLYLRSDILLLADVFENFRQISQQNQKVDPCRYNTSPCLSWSAMLKMTGVKLEFMTDVDMFQFIEKGMRGGISYIAHRRGIANNKYMSEYNPEKPSEYIHYLDANNLCGWAMSQCLPTGGFKWLTEKQTYKMMSQSILPDSQKGYILGVDLEYPEDLLLYTTITTWQRKR